MIAFVCCSQFVVKCLYFRTDTLAITHGAILFLGYLLTKTKPREINIKTEVSIKRYNPMELLS